LGDYEDKRGVQLGKGDRRSCEAGFEGDEESGVAEGEDGGGLI